MTRPFIGVPTTTDIAFAYNGAVFLERMNLLAPDGCGVSTVAEIPIGTELAIAFRLSSAAQVIKTRARVRGHTATTPAGLGILHKQGQRAFDDAMDVGDSATRVVRLADVEPPLAAAPAAGRNGGLCLAFVALSDVAKRAIAHHLDVAHKALAASPASGAKWRKRSDIGALFDEDSTLSDRAKDW